VLNSLIDVASDWIAAGRRGLARLILLGIDAPSLPGVDQSRGSSRPLD